MTDKSYGWLVPIATVITILVGMATFNYWLVSPVKEDVNKIDKKVEAIRDPQTGYMKAVRDGATEAVQRAVEKDDALKLRISIDVNRDLIKAMNELKVELSSQLEKQTKQLSGDLVRLQSALVGVQDRQALMLEHIFGGDQLLEPGKFPGIKMVPLWVVDSKDFESIMKFKGPNRGIYKIDAVK